ncbi:MAG: efflux RND transporter periplasmic adaptor subunit [Planctomycetes bacterium]|nr:efflux RND transporter periplasmic adaptor subunit [Planctomycetota bacterium]
MWKWITAAVVGMVAVAGGGAALAYKLGAIGPDAFNREKPAIEVIVTEAQRGELVRVVSAPGMVEPRTSVNVSARVSSTIMALPFREGDEVLVGDVLVRLDAEQLQARLAAARSRLKAEEARLTGSQASLVLAGLDYNRIVELHSTGDVSRAEMDRAKAQHAQAQSGVAAGQANIEMTQAEIDERRKDLQNAVISATMNGTITRLNLEVGEQVLGTLQNAGTVIMQIADLSEMLVKARIDETNVALVEPGQTVDIYLTAYPDRVFKGLVERIRLERQLHRDGTSYVEAEIVIEQSADDRLKIGLTANAEIAVKKMDDVLKVPTQAVLGRRIEDLPSEIVAGNTHIDKAKTFTKVVYRLVDGKAVATPVTTGVSDLSETVILGGLSAGDQIVSGPYAILEDLKHDQSIRDRDAPPVVAVMSDGDEEDDTTNAGGDGGEPAQDNGAIDEANVAESSTTSGPG